MLAQGQVVVPENVELYLTEEGLQLPGPRWGSLLLRIDTNQVDPEAKGRARACITEKVSEWLAAKERWDKGDLTLQVWGDDMVRTITRDEGELPPRVTAPMRTRADMAEGEEPEILPLPSRRRRNAPVEEDYTLQPDLSVDEEMEDHGEEPGDSPPTSPVRVEESQSSAPEPHVLAPNPEIGDVWVEVPGGEGEEVEKDETP